MLSGPDVNGLSLLPFSQQSDFDQRSPILFHLESADSAFAGQQFHSCWRSVKWLPVTWRQLAVDEGENERNFYQP